MSPEPTCTICGVAVVGGDPDADVLCAFCYTRNFAGDMPLDPPLVRHTLTLGPRDVQALRAYQRHVQAVREEDTHG